MAYKQHIAYNQENVHEKSSREWYILEYIQQN